MFYELRITVYESYSVNVKEALRLKTSAVVSFVGAGGKTSAMYRLANELADAGVRVVTTTTTRLFETQMALAPAVVTVEDGWTDDHARELQRRLEEYGHCLVVGLPEGEDGGEKRFGVSPELVAELHARPDVDVVLVEADGSRLRSFKAPARHEPVVPAVTTHLVPVVGVDAIGQPLADVHRPERVARLAGVTPDSRVTPAIVATVLAHPAGGAKGRPPGATLMPLVSKVEDDAALQQARAVASLLLQEANVDAVVIGAVQQEPPVREVWGRVAGIVLAAGESTRYEGETKQLLPWGETTLVGRAAQVALEAGLDPVIVVTGHDAERVAGAVEHLPVQIVYNPDYAAGQSTSVRRGVEVLPTHAGAAAFLLADQPGVTPEVVRAVVQAHRETLAPIVIPTYEGQRGNPVLFDRALFEEIRTIEGDTGGRALFAEHHDDTLRVAVDEAGISQDIDTPASYRRARERT